MYVGSKSVLTDNKLIIAIIKNKYISLLSLKQRNLVASKRNCEIQEGGGKAAASLFGTFV